MTDTTAGFDHPYGEYRPEPYENHPVLGAELTVPVEPDGVVADDATVAEDVTTEDAEPKINLSELSQSVNGFDQIAIRTRFHERFDVLADDPMMLSRALYFVHRRREGVKDAEAFQEAMLLTMGDLTSKFEAAPDGDEFEGDESAVAERDRQYAEFVMGTGLSYTLDQYMALTIAQRAAIIEAANNR